MAAMIRGPVARLLAFVIVVVSAVGLVAGAPASGSEHESARHCRDIHERGGQTARHLRVRRISCRLARKGVETYLGSPQGCLTSGHCIQSGVGSNPRSYVDCHRHGHRVRCKVVSPPKRGTVHFVVHPIGYPGMPGTRP